MPNAIRSAQILIERSERLAHIWRGVKGQRQQTEFSELDGLVDSFIERTGQMLAGNPGSPWTRCLGVLRLCHERGPLNLEREFRALKDVLECTMNETRASDGVLRLVSGTVDEARHSAHALLHRLHRPWAPRPQIPFGGIIVEVFLKPTKMEGHPTEREISVLQPTSAPLPHQP